MHHKRLHLGKLTVGLAVSALALLAQFAFASDSSKTSNDSVVVVRDTDGADLFAAIDSGPSSLSVAISPRDQSVTAVELSTKTEKLSQQADSVGKEQLVYERRIGSTQQRLEFDVNRADNTMKLRSFASGQVEPTFVSERENAPALKSNVSCESPESLNAVVQTAFDVDQETRQASLEQSKAVSGCSQSTATIARSAARLVSADAKISQNYLYCALSFPNFKPAVAQAIGNLTLQKENLFFCIPDYDSRKSPSGVEVGKDLQGETNSKKLSLELLRLLLVSTEKISVKDASDLANCCAGDESAKNSCRVLQYFSQRHQETSAATKGILRAALRKGIDDRKIKQFADKAAALEKKANATGKALTIAENDVLVSKIVNLCSERFTNLDCNAAAKERGSADSFSPSRTQVAAIPAAAKPAAQSPAQQPGAKPGTTPPTPALPQLNQRITYQRNDPASVRQALKKYEYMGPLAAAARKTADSISAQVSNVAVAATDGPSGASSEGFSYQSEPVEFKTGGGSISRIQVGNRSVYVKSTIPFGNRVGEPQTSVGSSPENLQPVSNTGARAKTQDPKRAAAATTGSSSAALDSTGGGGSQEPLPSGGGIGPSAQTPSARTGAGSRSVSSAQQSRFKSVTEFNTALVNEKNPRQFLSQSTETLRELKLQIVLKGESFPRNPDYNPRIYDFDELKRMMKR
jgi:hypothetical protein